MRANSTVQLRSVAFTVSLCAAAWIASAPSQAQDFDVNAVFWCDASRDVKQSPAECAATREVVLQNCTSCHTFVPIVKAQKSPDEWGAMLSTHRDKIADVPGDEITRIQQFLAARFNPQTPPPKLPPELEALGTQQAN